jgi:hypothetical protein
MVNEIPPRLTLILPSEVNNIFHEIYSRTKCLALQYLSVSHTDGRKMCLP